MQKTSLNHRKILYDNFSLCGYTLLFVTGNYVFVRNDLLNNIEDIWEPETMVHHCMYDDYHVHFGRMSMTDYNKKYTPPGPRINSWTILKIF